MVTKNSLNNTSGTFAVGNLSFATNTLSSTTGNIILAPFSGSRVSINSAYTLPASDGTSNQVLTTNGSGVVSFQTVSTTPFTWNVNTSSTTVNMVRNNGYINANNASDVTYTLPASAGLTAGDTFQIVNVMIADNFTVQLNSGAQTFLLGTTFSSDGPYDKISSTHEGDWLEIVYVSSSIVDFVINVKQGNVEFSF